ncbi:MAG TPA: PAS domain-containing protein [Terriglobales bacterium]|jgi:PAS domain-containing protein|nr:PAS domain-containing protein [Terriglobales bacterium]
MERLQIRIAEDLTQVRGACVICRRTFRVFVRKTVEDAIRLLQRSFKIHCRQQHGIVVKELPAGCGIDYIVENLSLPAYVFTRSSRKLIAANDRFREVMGYTESETKALSLEDLRSPEDIPVLFQSLSENFGEGVVQSRYRTKGGRSLRVRLRYRDLIVVHNQNEIPDACFVVLTQLEAA